jgi:hypothetical protein
MIMKIRTMVYASLFRRKERRLVFQHQRGSTLVVYLALAPPEEQPEDPDRITATSVTCEKT